MKKQMLLAIIVALLTGCLVMPQVVFGAQTLKVGVVDTYSGPAAPMGIDNLNGLKMAVNALNAKGGANGTTIDLVTRDDKFKPDIALAMAKDLILKEKVAVLVGTISSSCSLAISDYAKREKVPFINTGSKSEKITGEKGHRYVFSMDENTSMAGAAAAQVLAKKKFIKYWIAGDDMEYGRAITSSVWNHVKALKPDVQLLGQTWWKVGEADFGPYISQIMAAKPDCVILGNAGSSIIGFLKAAKASGLNKAVPLYLHASIDHTILSAHGLDSPEGVIGTINYLFYYPQTPENTAFVAEYQKLYGKVPTAQSFHGYNTGQLIGRGLQKLGGKFETEKFIDALDGMILDTAIGKLEMRACDHQLLLPTFVGVTKKVPEYKDFLIATDIVTVAPKDAVPTCEEVKKSRAAAK